jgi:hypothetical protein
MRLIELGYWETQRGTANLAGQVNEEYRMSVGTPAKEVKDTIETEIAVQTRCGRT